MLGTTGVVGPEEVPSVLTRVGRSRLQASRTAQSERPPSCQSQASILATTGPRRRLVTGTLGWRHSLPGGVHPGLTRACPAMCQDRQGSLSRGAAGGVSEEGAGCAGRSGCQD